MSKVYQNNFNNSIFVVYFTYKEKEIAKFNSSYYSS